MLVQSISGHSVPALDWSFLMLFLFSLLFVIVQNKVESLLKNDLCYFGITCIDVHVLGYF